MIVVPNIYITHGLKYSQDAQDVIDNFPATPTAGEIDAYAAFVDSQVASGNWAKIGNFVYGRGSISDNKYRYWKSATDIIKGDGSISSTFPNEVATGWENDGTRYLNLNYGVSDNANGAIDRFGFGAMTESITGYTTGSLYAVMGTYPTATRTSIHYFEAAANDLTGLIFGATSNSYGEGAATTMGLTMAEIVRDSYPSGSIRQKGYISGVNKFDNANTSTTLETLDFFGFCRNNNGSPLNYYEGVISTFIFFDPFEFDHASLSAELNTLRTAI